MGRQADQIVGLPDGDGSRQEDHLLRALRAGAEATFTELVRRHTPSLLRLARIHVGDFTAAEEVVQETWIGFLESLQRFEGRASVKTWLFRILLNKARTRYRKEGATVPFSSLEDDLGSYEPSVDTRRFRGSDDRWPGHWVSAPPSWRGVPEERFLANETFAVIEASLRDLPPAQRDVVTLRDVEGWTSMEVCNAHGLSETNQRVLLHRGRSKIRQALEQHLAGEAP